PVWIESDRRPSWRAAATSRSHCACQSAGGPTADAAARSALRPSPAGRVAGGDVAAGAAAGGELLAGAAGLGVQAASSAQPTSAAIQAVVATNALLIRLNWHSSQMCQLSSLPSPQAA